MRMQRPRRPKACCSIPSAWARPAALPFPSTARGGRQTDFKRDRMGNVVVSRLDEAALEKIALIGKGKYFRGTTSQDELDAIYKDVSALQKKEFGVKQFTDYEDRFQFFLAPVLILLILEFLLSERKTPWLSLEPAAAETGGGAGMIRWRILIVMVTGARSAERSGPVGPFAGEQGKRQVQGSEVCGCRDQLPQGARTGASSLSRDISIWATPCTSRGNMTRRCGRMRQHVRRQKNFAPEPMRPTISATHI